MIIPLLVLAAVFLLVAFRQTAGIKIGIWQIFLAGAAIVVATGQIPIPAALASVNVQVIAFLFGAFVIGQSLEASGYLAHATSKIFNRAKSADALLALMLIVMGVSSAILMNDTLAIIGTPVVLMLSKEHAINAKPVLLALAFSVTIGSVLSPIGNPQNLLISVSSNVANPFITFLRYLLLPTLINLAAAYFVIKKFYKSSFHDKALVHRAKDVKDAKLARLAKLSLSIMVLLVIAKITLAFLNPSLDKMFDISYISLVAAAPIVLFSQRRIEIVRNIDWSTLAFFVGLFILVQSVWLTNFFQSAISAIGINPGSIPVIIVTGVVLSQFISNVPFAALYSHILSLASLSSLQVAALAAGSTIAGNLLILGAASNVIIINNAEKRTKDTVTFWEFAKVGIPLTIINMIVYILFLSLKL